MPLPSLGYWFQTREFSRKGSVKVMALMGAGKRFLQAAVDDREGGACGNLRAEWCGYWVPPGRLPQEYREKIIADVRRGRVFVVFSYATPVAWYAPGEGWTVPDVRYSPTTSNHQHILRVAIDNPGFYSDAKW